MSRLKLNALRYAIVGVLNTVIGLSFMWAVLFLAPEQTVLANAVGFAAGFTISFALNRTWTFSDRRPLRLNLGAYMALVAVCYAANLVVVLVARGWPALGIYLPQLLGMGTYTVLVFLGSYFIVFKAEPAQDLA